MEVPCPNAQLGDDIVWLYGNIKINREEKAVF